MNKKDNQRTRLTKLLFKNSLISLLQKKSIYQISVTELCDAAELNRSTFYKYYDNVSDILTELEKETLQKGRQCIQEMADESNDSHITPIYRLLCEIQENREIYRLLLNNSMNGDFPFNMLQETIALLRDDVKSFAAEENATSNYLLQYMVSGCISVIQNWLNEPMAESPMEISQIIYKTSIAVLRIQNNEMI